MTNEERKAVGQALARLAVVSAGQELDEMRLALYLEQLDRNDAAQVLAVIERLMRTAKFFPALGEILEQIEGTAEIRAAEAWAALRHGDPVTEETVRLIGGWHAIGQTYVDKMHFMERRFCELYPSVEAKHRAGLLAPAPKLAAGIGGLRRIGGA